MTPASGQGPRLQRGSTYGPTDDLGSGFLPRLEEENEFVRTMRGQAAARGIDAASITDKYTMRREL